MEHKQEITPRQEKAADLLSKLRLLDYKVKLLTGILTEVLEDKEIIANLFTEISADLASS